jgi:RNA polymerase sigma-70 factor (ECF subfamily)
MSATTLQPRERPAGHSGRNAFDFAGTSDAELGKLAQRGDRDAFVAIMQRSNRRLLRLARRVVKDENEAEDVLQEAYTRAFAAIAGFRAEASIFSWLTQITLNEARGRLRKRRPLVGLAALERSDCRDAQVAMCAPFGAGTPETDLMASEARRLLLATIEELPPGYRTVLILRSIEECTTDETARRLGLLPETVKTRLFRARRLMRTSIRQKLSGAAPAASARPRASRDLSPIAPSPWRHGGGATRAR